ncbi:MAG: zinc-ribbon domain-containing protein [Akkermansiaceae bacterium]|nr:zinc-ribbon domain-containing protein [Akkermansiaceae bacterium]MCP5549773.1 zinc-ribbon domain-containing protein [Akkermansiaceae bacterium]
MSFCPNCGHTLEPNAHFCPECGNAVENAPPTARAQPTPAQPTPVMSSPSTSPVPGVAPAVPAGKGPSGCKIAALILGGLLLLAVIGIGALVMLLGAMTKPLVTAADGHFAALRSGNDQAAYEMTAQAFKENTSLSDYQAFINQRPILRQVTGSSYSSKNIENDKGTLEGALIAEDGQQIPIQIILFKEGGEWKIVSIDFNSGQ